MIISLSILNIKKEELKERITQFEQVDSNNYLHFDIMDGNFVSNKTFDESLVKEIDQYSKLFKDVHLMVTNPFDLIKRYSQAKADQITFHYEAVKKEDIVRLIQYIKSLKMKVGISIKPNTSIELIKEFLPLLDYVLVMSVEPGMGGQSYLDLATEKIAYLKRLRKNSKYLIAVDGGINEKTSKIVKEAGADVIIVGSYLANKDINKELIKSLK